MRRAFTLIEMSVSIVVGAALLTVAISLLMALLGAGQSGSTHAGQSESLQRLANQFRRDVHAAVGQPAAGPENRHGCKLSFSEGGSVRYTIGGDSVSREEQTGKKTILRESYVLPKGSTAKIAVDRAASPATVSLTIVPSDPSVESGPEIRIDAVFGHDHRFETTRKEGK
jgi:prepilin-type N-terminal cleavage/methylation domain-containing protein